MPSLANATVDHLRKVKQGGDGAIGERLLEHVYPAAGRVGIAQDGHDAPFGQARPPDHHPAALARKRHVDANAGRRGSIGSPLAGDRWFVANVGDSASVRLPS
jgi:hypothetical protein